MVLQFMYVTLYHRIYYNFIVNWIINLKKINLKDVVRLSLINET